MNDGIYLPFDDEDRFSKIPGRNSLVKHGSGGVRPAVTIIAMDPSYLR